MFCIHFTFDVVEPIAPKNGGLGLAPGLALTSAKCPCPDGFRFATFARKRILPKGSQNLPPQGPLRLIDPLRDCRSTNRLRPLRMNSVRHGS